MTTRTENTVITSWSPPVGPPNETERAWAAPPLDIVRGQFFPEFEVTDPDALFKREKAAFDAMLPKLKQESPGKYVAVHDGRPEVVGSTESDVLRSFFGKFGDTHVYIGYVGDTEPATYQVSPFSF